MMKSLRKVLRAKMRKTCRRTLLLRTLTPNRHRSQIQSLSRDPKIDYWMSISQLPKPRKPRKRARKAIRERRPRNSHHSLILLEFRNPRLKRLRRNRHLTTSTRSMTCGRNRSRSTRLNGRSSTRSRQSRKSQVLRGSTRSL